MNTPETTKPKTEKVGVLLVHGIGEQRQFEHLESEARNIALTLQKYAAQANREHVIGVLEKLVAQGEVEVAVKKIKNGNLAKALRDLDGKIKDKNFALKVQGLVSKIPNLSEFELAELAAKKLTGKAQVVRVAVNSFPNATFGAEQETWHDGNRAPVMVEVYDQENDNILQTVQIYFHQVWWADLDEPVTLGSEIRFWLWGLSLWAIKGKPSSGLPGSNRMKLPNGQLSIGWKDRVRLFVVSLVVLLILPTLSFLNFISRKLLVLNIPRPDILARFIGDVKLFQQEKRVGKGPLQDLGSPPRVTIRRRMIRKMVEMALHPYERWYILAHSQGTVLAFNGIMETAQSLPNYLTHDLWRRSKAQLPHRNPLVRKAQTVDEQLSDEEKENMQPSFPSWRDKEYILDRRELFKNLRGLLTYGSPLSKFAALWPAIVPLNEDKHVFHQDFRWLNIYDPTDPVAGETAAFQCPRDPAAQIASGYKVAEPLDFAYKASRFHLLSHGEYLTYNQSEHPLLADLVANWILEGNLTAQPEQLSVQHKNLTRNKVTTQQGDFAWPKRGRTSFYRIFRKATWLFAALLIGSFLSIIIAAVPQLGSFLQSIIGFPQSLISSALSVIPSWLGWGITAVFFAGLFSIVISLIVGTRFMLKIPLISRTRTFNTQLLGIGIGCALGIFTPAVITVIFADMREKLLGIILTAIAEGFFYIVLGVVVIFLVGATVKLFVGKLEKL